MPFGCIMWISACSAATVLLMVLAHVWLDGNDPDLEKTQMLAGFSPIVLYFAGETGLKRLATEDQWKFKIHDESGLCNMPSKPLVPKYAKTQVVEWLRTNDAHGRPNYK